MSANMTFKILYLFLGQSSSALRLRPADLVELVVGPAQEHKNPHLWSQLEKQVLATASKTWLRFSLRFMAKSSLLESWRVCCKPLGGAALTSNSVES